ncbi:DUF4192 domain-containing protein [Rhodococcus qingshengii]|uniref:DUF4192 family protein n=1 Tax=Rhodococcus qingshengii TaxID=334542 RepID=UPI001E39E8E4|nr:DUF4192 family protein [Rhodococcus qingshengii]UGQ51185.1 DUF4192 domain-containing protein [Rhodococcus qingshengii]UUE25344.1 DUF4192 domain-containing protein [Rhodococcus qingshengii]
MRHAFTNAGIEVARALHAPSLEAGARWTDLDSFETGSTADHRISDINMAYVEDVRATDGSREEIIDRFTKTTQAPTAPTHEAKRIQGDDFVRITILELGAVIGARAVPTADLAARVGLCATVSASARNAQMAVFTQGERDADSFATIACQVRGSARVQDLTLTGYCAYLTNDGSTASIAFEAVMSTATAAGCTPAQTNLRRLLDGALHNGVPRPRSPRSSPRYTSTSRSPSASTSTTPRAERKREQPRLRIRSRGYSRTRWRLFGHRARTTAAPTPRATTMQRLAGKSVEQTAGRTGNREHDIHPFRGIGFDGLAGDDGREIRAGDHAQMLRCLIQRRLHRRSGGGAVDRR